MTELELLGALFVLKLFTRLSTRVSVRLMLDNSTTVHYVKKSGGSKSEELSWISFEIVAWWEHLAMSINASRGQKYSLR